MMKTTMTLSQSLNLSPFEIFAQDCDEVIMMINFYLILADEKPKQKAPFKSNRRNYEKNERIRVNDKTATGGWF